MVGMAKKFLMLWTRSPLPVPGDPAHSPLLYPSLYLVTLRLLLLSPLVPRGSSQLGLSWPLGHSAEPLSPPHHQPWGTLHCSSLSSSLTLSSVQQQLLFSL